MSESEPARPPPPKSYVPITLLEGPMVPTLPPRPQGNEAQGGVPPRPQPRTTKAAPQPTVNSNETDVSSTTPITASNGVDKDDTPPPSSQQPPVKPARHKNKKGPPKPPSPYSPERKKTLPPSESESLISFTFDGNDGDAGADAVAADLKAAGNRRHTIASRPKPKDSPPQERKSSDFSREKFSPPEVMLDSLYSTVEKNKRYPAPNMPAPPPPYDGSTMKKIEGNSIPERTASPPGYELVAGNTASSTTASSGKKPSSGALPIRPPPSRPSRPPAANPPPSKDPQSMRSRSATMGSTGYAPPRARGKKAAAKAGGRPEITIMDAKPMNSDIIPSPYLDPAAPPKTKPPSSRPSPPQPRRPPLAEASAGPPKPKPPAVRPSPPPPKRPLSAGTSSEPPKPRHPAARPSPPPPKKSISSEPVSDPQGAAAAAPPPSKPERNSARKAPPRPGHSPTTRRPPPPRVGSKGSPPAPRKGNTEDSQPDDTTPEDVVQQLSELGPPPDEDPPDLPSEVINEAAALLDDDEEEVDKPESSPPDAPSQDLKLAAEVASDQQPQKPPHPPAPRRGKPPPPKSPSSTPPTAAKKQDSPKLPVPSSRPPPPKPSKRQSHDTPDDKPNQPPTDSRKTPPLSTRSGSVDSEGASGKDETEEGKDQARLKRKPSGPKRPPPVKRPPAPKPVSRKEKDKVATNEATGEATPPVPAARSSTGQKDGAQPPEADVVEEQESIPKPIKRPPSIRRPPPPRKTTEPAESIVEQPESETKATEVVPEADDVESIPKPIKHPPSIRRPPPPRKTTEPAESIVEQPESETKATEVVPEADVMEEQESVPKPAKRPPSIRRPPPPRKTMEPAESIVEQPESEIKATEVVPEADVQESLPKPVKRPPSIKRPPPPRKTVEPAESIVEQPESEAKTTAVKPDGEQMSEESKDNPAPAEPLTPAMESQQEIKAGASISSEAPSKGEAPKPSVGKRLSINKPPPPVTVKPKSKSPTPVVSPKASVSPESTPEPVPEPAGEQQEASAEPASKEEVKAPVGKKLSIKKPSPPVTVKPKSKSPTPVISPKPSVSPETTPEPAVEQQEVLTEPLAPASKEEKKAPIGKKLSIKKPPPPVTAKPRSMSPTPISPTPASLPSTTVGEQPEPIPVATKRESATKLPSSPEQESPVSVPVTEASLPSEASKDDEPSMPEVHSAEDKAELPKPPGPQPRTRPPPPTTQPQAKVSPKGSIRRPPPPSTQPRPQAKKSPPQRPSQPSPKISPKGSVRKPSKTSPKGSIRRPPPKASSEEHAPPPPSQVYARTSPLLSIKKKTDEERENLEEGVHVLRYSRSNEGSREPSPSPPTSRAGGISLKQPHLSSDQQESEGDGDKDIVTATADSPPPHPRTIRDLPPPVPGRPFPPPTNSSGPPPAKPGPPPAKPGPPSAKPGPPPAKPGPPSAKPGPPLSKPGPPIAAARPAGLPKRPGPTPTNKPSRPSAPAPAKQPTPTKPSAPSKPPAPSKPSARPSKSSTRPPDTKSAGQPSGPPSLPPRPTPGHLLYKYVCTEPHGIATTQHDANDEDELSYQEGDVIELVEKVDENWYFAANADLGLCEGLILANHLKIVKRLPGQDTVAGFEEGPCAVATHDFQGQSIDELSFKAGDLIMLKTRYGDSWFRGKLIGGNEGIFPKNFVEVVEELPADAYEAPAAQLASTAAQDTEEMRGPHCMALYPFSAAGEGELSIAEGDRIELLERVDADWLRGRLGGSEGIFPAEFVNVVEDLPPAAAKKSEPKAVGGAKPPAAKGSTGHMSTALYDFDGNEGELTFKAGDKIRLVSRVSAEWVNGEVRGAKGMFPADFVDSVPGDLPKAGKEEKDASKEESKPKPSGTGKCESLYEFEGAVAEGELSFGPGETITTLEKVNEEWMKGRIGSREGIFPIGFVKIISEIPPKAKPSSPIKKAANLKPVTSRGAKSNTTILTDDLMPKGVALVDYNAASSDEISFREGEVLYLLSKEGKNRYMGERVDTGDLGNFPANCIDVVVPLP